LIIAWISNLKYIYIFSSLISFITCSFDKKTAYCPYHSFNFHTKIIWEKKNTNLEYTSVSEIHFYRHSFLIKGLMIPLSYIYKFFLNKFKFYYTFKFQSKFWQSVFVLLKKYSLILSYSQEVFINSFILTIWLNGLHDNTVGEYMFEKKL